MVFSDGFEPRMLMVDLDWFQTGNIMCRSCFVVVVVEVANNGVE